MSTNIQWTDETWNPIRARPFVVEAGKADGWHCEHVSEGCRNCYAEALNEAQRFDRGTGLAYTRPNREKVEVYLDEPTLTQPLHWRKPRRVFVCSMTDLFGEWVTDEMLDRVFAAMALTPHTTYQVLTKRPERMRAYLTSSTKHEFSSARRRVCDVLLAEAGTWWKGDAPSVAWPLPNVWLGTSVEDQSSADLRIPELLATPAAVRFLSCEPLLGPIEFSDVSGRSDAVRQMGQPALVGIDWVIAGGESGGKARPCDVAWIRSIVAQCQAAGVAVFVKQLGARPVTSTYCNAIRTEHPIKLRDRHGGDPSEWPADLRVREFPGGVA